MKTTRAVLLKLPSLVIAGSTLLCSSGAAAQTIAREVPGQVEIIAPWYLRDPDVTFWSYAAANVGGCSGNMIGPNTLMTAAHCDFGAFATPVSVTFKAYRSLDRSTFDTEVVSCWKTIQTLPSGSDVALFYCPNINGLPPGLKYGYMDFDASSPRVGQPLYSVWRNNVGTIGTINDAVLYSPGKITFQQFGFNMDLWGNYGGSGSAHIRPDTHRIHIGPASTATPDGPGRYAIPMYDYLNTAILDTTQSVPQINKQQLPVKLKLPNVTDLSQFDGLLDKNHNNVFDIQEAIERIDGEARRNHYWLGFQSERRNALWQVSNSGGVAVRFQPSNQDVNLDIRSGGLLALVHNKLNLKPSTDYRVSVMVHTNSTSHPHALSFRLLSVGLVDVHDIPTNPGTGWEMNTFHLRTGSNSSALYIVSKGAVNASLANLSLIEEGALMDFDTHDKRVNWRNDSNGQRAFILPDGRKTTADGPDWAAQVGPTPGVTAAGSWPLRNRQLAFVAGGVYQICFHHRHYRSAVSATYDWASMRLTSGNKVIANQMFRPQADRWTRTCTGFFTVESGDNNLQFGLSEGVPQGVRSYLVDDIEIIRG